jgi:hypothetical protein
VAGSRAGRLGRITAAASIAVLPLLHDAQPAQAGPSAGWCSETGDSCEIIESTRAGLVVRTVLAERYVDRTRVCVVAPSGRRLCRTRAVLSSGGVWAASFTVPRPARGLWRVGPSDEPGGLWVGRRSGPPGARAVDGSAFAGSGDFVDAAARVCAGARATRFYAELIVFERRGVRRGVRAALGAAGPGDCTDVTKSVYGGQRIGSASFVLVRVTDLRTGGVSSRRVPVSG